MKYLYILMYLGLFLGCFPRNNSQCLDFPKLIEELKLQDQYNFAKWELYRHNLTKGDQSLRWIPSSREAPLPLVSLASLNLELLDVSIDKDTITFDFLFEDGLAPSEHSYYRSITIWGDNRAYGLNYYDHGGYIQDMSWLQDSVFYRYLSENFDSLNCWLKEFYLEKLENQ